MAKKESGYNINIPRYVDIFEEEEPIDIEAVAKGLRGLDKKGQEVNKEIEKYCEELEVNKPF